ncbi:unnamed protein product [Blepharisma stoltei]|uniref:Ubiquitin-like domain-containing protein n=1 Tax=Blepharisma stoltei TaxID=1481888 RepID=A0AAU9KAN0_9CILI|nr:unnamed protein product [Blepharisma stoltei]
MQLFLKCLDGKYLAICTSLEETVKSFKKKVSEKTKIPIEEICLISHSKILTDSFPLHYYQLHHGETVSLHLPLKGGGCANSKSNKNTVKPIIKKLIVSTSCEKIPNIDFAAENTFGKTPQSKGNTQARFTDISPNQAASEEFKDFEIKSPDCTPKDLDPIEVEISQIICSEILEKFLYSMSQEYLQWINQEIELREQIMLRDSFRTLSVKSIELIGSQLIETIFRILVETIIHQSSIDRLVESLIINEIEAKISTTKNVDEIKKFQSKIKSIYNERLQELIYEEILEAHINELNLQKISENTIKSYESGKRRTTLASKSSLIKVDSVDEPEDYVNEVFTPGEHSPNEYSLNDVQEEEKVEKSIVENEKTNTKAKKNGANYAVNLKTSCVIEVINERIEISETFCDEILEFGNRQCLLYGLLNLFGAVPKNSIILSQNAADIRLQNDTTNMLEIINSIDSYSFMNITGKVLPNKAGNEKFLRENNLPANLASNGKSAISILDLSFQWKSSRDLVQPILGKPRRFISFEPSDIEVYKSYNLEIYNVTTSQPHLIAIFIQSEDLKNELKGWAKRNKTDLYSHFEDTFKDFGENGKKPSELWVPAFRKQISYDVPWIQGYEIPPQGNKNNFQFVKKCRETINLDFSTKNPPPKGNQTIKQKGKILNKDFVFGLAYTNLDKEFHGPLFLCVVEPKDFVPAN